MSGQRRYDETALQRLAIIRFAKFVGFSLEEISQLLDGTRLRPAPNRWRRMAHAKIGDLDAAVSHASLLKRMLLETLSDKCPKLVERGSAMNAT
jgi:DNA-binding transcriptional MerR regulator